MNFTEVGDVTVKDEKMLLYFDVRDLTNLTLPVNFDLQEA